MAFSVDQFGKALVSAGLFTADELKALWNAIPADARPKQGDGFAKLLVQQGKLNQFQADELLSGRNTPLVMGDYLLVAELGAGGMGKVYKARHRRMERIVALKVMSTAAMQDEAAVKRFQREVKAAARLEHPNIVTAYDSGESGKVKYLVMQFVDGGDLSQLVKHNGPLEIERAVDYVLQAARGLAFAHGEGVVHRDIKPANLLLDKKGVVKILDMGLARIEGGDGLTATEQVMGTVDYMSPEQAANTKTADGRSDIYSLGCTLWFLLTAKKLYDGDTMISRLMSHRTDPLPSLVKARDDVPWSLEQAFHKMIAKSPEDRFQSMDEVVAALEPFAPSGGSRSGVGSSIGMGPQSAEMASFLKSIGPAVKPQTKPAPSKTNVNVEATAQFAAAGADTDPKSQLLPPSKKAAQPQAKGLGGKKPPNKNLLLAAAGGGALLVLLGVWFIFRDKDGNEVARVQMPDGGSVTVQQPTATAGKAPVAAPTRPAVSFFLPNSTPASPSGTTTPPSVAPPPAVASSNGVVYLDDLSEIEAIVGVSSLGKHGKFVDKDKSDKTVLWRGGPVAHSLFMHPVTGQTSFVRYQIDGGYATFAADVGISESANAGSPVIFRVLGDSRELWKSQPLQKRGESAAVSVDIRGVKELRLETSCGANSQGSHATWFMPRLTPIASTAPSPAVVYLDDLPETAFECKGPLRKHGDDRDGKALNWLGQKPSHSLLTHPVGVHQPAWVTYALDGRYAEFRTTVGAYIAPESPLVFRIFGDGKPLWESKPQAAAQVAEDAVVDVRGVKVLKLEVGARGSVSGAHAVWIEPRLTPVSIAAPPAGATVGPAPPLAVAPFDAAQAKAHQAAWAKHLGTTVETTNSIGMRMTLLPPGEFLMGSSDADITLALKIAEETKLDTAGVNRIQEERPQHTVRITKPLRLSAHEVTIGQFAKFVEQAKYKTQAEEFGGNSDKVKPEEVKPDSLKLNWRTPGQAVTDDSPVTQVSWNDAVAFCNWLSSQEKLDHCYERDADTWTLLPKANGYRLPTEAEWEYACRAGTTTQYSFGDNWQDHDKYGWTNKNAGGRPHAVGSLPANPFGLYDMHGNVWEWCQDWYDGKWYEQSPGDDPLGPSRASYRVGRGGSWDYMPARSRSSSRSSNSTPSHRFHERGFRPALSSVGAQSSTASVSPQPAVPAASSGKLFMHDPAFPQWMKDVQAMPAEQQIEAVRKKLMELNPGFDGKVTDSFGRGTPKIEAGVVTDYGFLTAKVTDISPVRALSGLKSLRCTGLSQGGEGDRKLTNLSPLSGMHLTFLDCTHNYQLSDLSPLNEMPLLKLHCFATSVSELSPLQSCERLQTLRVGRTKVTPASVAALQKALPNCKIEWDDPAKATTTPATGTK